MNKITQLNTKQAAKVLMCSPSVVRMRILRNQIKADRWGRDIVINTEDLARHIVGSRRAYNHKFASAYDMQELIRLEYLRGEIESERISYGEIAELESLAEYIAPDDAVLSEWAGIPEDVFNNTGVK